MPMHSRLPRLLHFWWVLHTLCTEKCANEIYAVNLNYFSQISCTSS
jgi:hypothetical protein